MKIREVFPEKVNSKQGSGAWQNPDFLKKAERKEQNFQTFVVDFCQGCIM